MVDVRVKGLFLTDPTNISLQQYTNMINKLLEKGTFSSKYKSYDSTKGEVVTFICFSIESVIERNGFVLQSFIYQGNLVFSYNQTTHAIWISELPKYGDEKNSISLFTSDILSIIVEKIKNYVEIDKIVIDFKDTYQKFAIDNHLYKILPQIENNINYKRMCLIYEQMCLEEERIKREVLEEKKRKDKEDAIKERVVAEKSIIYGIDQRDYEDYFAYLDAVNKKICEVCDYKISNINRHIEANKKKYIALLRKNDKGHKGLKDILNILSWDWGFGESEYCHNEVFQIIVSNLEETSKKVEVTEQLLDIYYEAIYQYDSDLSNKRSLISLLSHIRNNRGWVEGRYDEEGKMPSKPNDMYHYILGVGYYYGSDEEIINYKNPIFNGSSRIVQKDFKKCVDTLFQIASLKKQLVYYENMRSNPDKALINFQNSRDSWNSILHFPYWLRIGRDSSRKANTYSREKYNLLMIKPGVKDIDLDHIRVFTRNNGQEFGSTKVERQEYLQKLIQGEIKFSHCSRLIITIPKSLHFENVIRLIDYAHQYGSRVLFICETSDVAVTIKEILVDRAIQAYKQISSSEPCRKVVLKTRGKYFKNECFLCVDPTYFSNFMLDTPTNKAFWHRYDYTGSYKYRKQEPASLDYVFDRTIYENMHDGKVDYERVTKQLLGSYSSKETEVLPVSISIIDFMDGYDDFRMLPECQGLNFDELMKYVNMHYADHFYLDERDRDNLYDCSYVKEDDPKYKEILRKKLIRKFVCDEELYSQDEEVYTSEAIEDFEEDDYELPFN